MKTAWRFPGNFLEISCMMGPARSLPFSMRCTLGWLGGIMRYLFADYTLDTERYELRHAETLCSVEPETSPQFHKKLNACKNSCGSKVRLVPQEKRCAGRPQQTRQAVRPRGTRRAHGRGLRRRGPWATPGLANRRGRWWVACRQPRGTRHRTGVGRGAGAGAAPRHQASRPVAVEPQAVHGAGLRPLGTLRGRRAAGDLCQLRLDGV